MSKRLISNCDLNFHCIKKVSFEVKPPYLKSELLKIHFEDAEGDVGTLNLFCDPIVQIESATPLTKLKKIIVDISGLKLRFKRRAHE